MVLLARFKHRVRSLPENLVHRGAFVEDNKYAAGTVFALKGIARRRSNAIDPPIVLSEQTWCLRSEIWASLEDVTHFLKDDFVDLTGDRCGNESYAVGMILKVPTGKHRSHHGLADAVCCFYYCGFVCENRIEPSELVRG